MGGRLAQTEVFFFREPKDDSVPLLEWLEELPTKVQAKCTERIDRLGELGHELRRPEADLLRAMERKKKVEANFEQFTFRPE
jgi:hypothetical protein